MIRKGEELDQFLTRLGFPDLAGPDIESLLSAADGNLDWLLSRLRTLFKQEQKFIHFAVLVNSVL